MRVICNANNSLIKSAMQQSVYGIECRDDFDSKVSHFERSKWHNLIRNALAITNDEKQKADCEKLWFEIIYILL